MAREEIYTGLLANDGTGDTLRVASFKTNNNFSELYYHHANNLIAHDYLETHTDEGIYNLQERVNTTIGTYSVIFNYANSVNANLVIAYGKVNSAYVLANDISLKVNACYTLSNSSNIILTAAYRTTNSAFNKANNCVPLSGGTISGDLIVLGNTTLSSINIVSPVLYNTVNLSYYIANTSYNFANGVSSNTTSAYNFANGVSVNTTAAFTRANNSLIIGSSAYDFANGVSVNTTASFTKANVAIIVGGAGFDQANAQAIRLTAAFEALNTSIGVINTNSIKLNTAYSTTNSAYALINTAYSTINLASNNINVLSNVLNTVFVVSNASYNLGNTLLIFSSTIFDTTNAAFDKANAANVLAYNTGIGANNYAGAMANSINAFSSNIYTTLDQYTTFYNFTLIEFGSLSSIGNSALNIANISYNFANGVSVNTTAAFNKANSSLQNTSATLNGTLTVANTIVVRTLKGPYTDDTDASANGGVALKEMYYNASGMVKIRLV